VISTSPLEALRTVILRLGRILLQVGGVSVESGWYLSCLGRGSITYYLLKQRRAPRSSLRITVTMRDHRPANTTANVQITVLRLLKRRNSLIQTHKRS